MWGGGGATLGAIKLMWGWGGNTRGYRVDVGGNTRGYKVDVGVGGATLGAIG